MWIPVDFADFSAEDIDLYLFYKTIAIPVELFFPFIYLIVRLAFGLLEVLGPTVKQSPLSSVSSI